MSEICVVCTTPYQIIAATAIVLDERLSADLFIVPRFAAAREYAERIRELAIYRNVSVVDTSKADFCRTRRNPIVRGVGIVCIYLFDGYLVRDITGGKPYKAVYISSQARIGRLISLYYAKRGAEIIYFDDGEGSYDSWRIYGAHGIDIRIRGLMFGRDSVKLSDKRKLYFPELYRKTFGDYGDVSKICNWSGNPSYLPAMNYICGYSPSLEIKNKFVLLDTIPEEVFDADGIGKYREIMDICAEKLGAKLMIKRHPRDERARSGPCPVYQDSSMPFEIICANSDIGNKALITVTSTSAFMPKILFDAEPVVIMLYRITGLRSGRSEKRETFISSVKEMYRDKSRFIVPETIDEFKRVLDALAD